jgi:membrane-bound lytic murein transglycosylase D
MRARRSSLLTALAASTLGLAACQTVGGYGYATAPRPLAAAAPLAAATGLEELMTPKALVPGSPHVAEAEVEGKLDPILDSPISFDSSVQDATRTWVEAWTTRQMGTFERYLARMGEWEGLVGNELEARELPPSLRYLPIVESGYSPLAVSRVGATGLWQITDPTARHLGLTVNSIVDDRRDPVASTDAALEYLGDLYDEFGSWYLALAAYNAGPGRIQRLLDRYAAGSDLTVDERYLRIQPHLPAETRNFVPRLLAAATLAQKADAFGLPAPDSAPVAFDEVTVPDATSLDVIATAAGVDEGTIRQLNPQYVRNFTPVGETRTVRVPAGLGLRFERAFAVIPPEQRLTFVEHVVAKGETFTGIAHLYGIPLAELTDRNRELDPRRLQIGTRIVVPIANGEGSAGGA